MKKPIPSGIYGITAEEYSRGRNNIEVARMMIRGGVSIIQYREKENKSIREKYLECLKIRKITERANVLFIVNDFLDIACAVDADGVHIGQNDFPLPVARRLIGEEKIIGISTHSPEQAKKALKEGADYIGVGPIFKTSTKRDVVPPVGLEYLEYVRKNIHLPFVAIGGIKEENIEEVLMRGARLVALVTEIVGADDIIGKIKRLRKIFRKYNI